MSDTQSSRETQAPADDPIERVAAALRGPGVMCAVSEADSRFFATEVIAALREPSSAMIAAGRKHTDLHHSWQAMVDALLAEGRR